MQNPDDVSQADLDRMADDGSPIIPDQGDVNG